VHRLLFSVVVLLAAGLWSAEASAQVGGPNMRLGVGMVLDFGGEVDADYGPGADLDDDLKLTPGMRAHLDYDVGRYVSVGGALKFSFWEGDDHFETRNLWVDFLARINGHYDWRDFRFYIALTLGPSLSHLKHAGENYGMKSNAPGVAVQIAPGVEYWFSSRFGAYLEMFGWSGHYFHHKGEDTDRKVDFAANQVVWQLGINFGL
jgi:hypothetical protein